MNKLRERFNVRELILIGVLLFVGLAYLYLEFLVFPFYAEIEEKEATAAVLTEELIQKRSTASRLSKLEEEYQLLQNDLLEKRLLFYPTDNQEYFINTLEDMAFDEDDLSVPSINFSEPVVAEDLAEDLAEGLYRFTTTFDYVSDYESIKDFIVLLENEGEKVTITNLIMLEDRINDQYSGSMTVEFYSVPRPFEYEWSTEILADDDTRVVNQNIFHRDLELWKELDREEINLPTALLSNNNQSNSTNDDVSNGDQEADDSSDGDTANEPDVDYFDEVIHVVEEGETFDDLSLLYYGKSYYDIFLREMNNYSLDEEPATGDEIIIPGVMYLKDK
jgi:hypothetical protein